MSTTSPSAETSTPQSTSARPNWLVRHEFLLRRLHSLTGLIPVGAYMVVHLLTNASVVDSPSTFQQNVYRIHSLGKFLPVVEWGFIFLPIIFHAVFGVVIIRSGMLNYGNYPTRENARYSLQRISGMIAFLFIFWHVFHMHGWFHFESWLEGVAHPLGGAEFRPYNAASSLAMAMQGYLVPILYAIGVLASVFHLANGIWTMGITWGVWVSPGAQRRANWVCAAFGVGLAVVSMMALRGATSVPLEKALDSEQQMYEAKVDARLIEPNTDEHKRWSQAELEQVQAEIERRAADTQSNRSSDEQSAGNGGES